MKKILGLILALAMVFTMVGGALAVDQSQSSLYLEGSEQTLIYADNHADGYPTVEASKAMAQEIYDNTDGRIGVAVYSNAVLGNENDAIEQLTYGAVQLVRASVASFASYSNKLNVLCLPYLFNNYDHYWKVLGSEIGDDMLNACADANIIGLCWYDGGARCFFTKDKITDLSGFKGKTIRMLGSLVDMLSAMGGNPSTMAMSEIYAAIQTGVVDGAENNWPTYYEQTFYEVAPYFMVDNHARLPEWVAINGDAWNSLSADDQAIVKTAALNASTLEKQLWNEYEEKSREGSLAAGAQEVILSDDALAEIKSVAVSVYDKYSEYADIIAAIQAMAD
ncbi:MAG: TRAP transporter substrate-binding protein [Eubacteriales bacterium]|nr:TRAP transporter substrate-binding protein [Eubacteriales bacterium]